MSCFCSVSAILYLVIYCSSHLVKKTYYLTIRLDIFLPGWLFQMLCSWICIAQLTFEQHKFELHWSTCESPPPHTNYYSNTWWKVGWMLECGNEDMEELHIDIETDYKLHADFWLWAGSASLPFCCSRVSCILQVYHTVTWKTRILCQILCTFRLLFSWFDLPESDMYVLTSG